MNVSKVEMTQKPLRMSPPDENQSGNSPLKKKFKFSPTAIKTQNLDTEMTDLSQQSPSSQVQKRKGFVAPRKNPDFYGDDEDDDFQ